MSRHRRNRPQQRPLRSAGPARPPKDVHRGQRPSPGTDNPLTELLRPALRSQDPTAFWAAAAPFVQTVAEPESATGLPEGVDLLQTFIEIDVAETTALLHMVAALSPQENLRSRALEALSTRRQPMPPQVTELARAAPTGAMILSDDEADSLIIEITLPGGQRAVLVTHIEIVPLPHIKDSFVADAPLEAMGDMYRRAVAEHGLPVDEGPQRLPLEEASDLLAEALAGTPATPFTGHAAATSLGTGQESGQWPMLRPLVEFICELLPSIDWEDEEDHGEDGWLGPRPEGPPWRLASGGDLVEEFFASEQAHSIERTEAAVQTVMLLSFMAVSTHGDPLDWTEELAVWAVGTTLPQEPMLDAQMAAVLPSVMPALITWSHRRSESPEEQTETVLAAIAPLLEDLPHRYAHPANRAIRLEEGYVNSFESRDWAVITRAELILRVGGAEELEALDDAPLPAEPLALDQVPEDLHERLAEIDAELLAGLRRLEDIGHRLPDPGIEQEFVTACRRLLARAAHLDPAALRRRASTRITAGAIAWLIGRSNDLAGHPPAPVRSGDLMAAFGINGSPSQRADTLRRAACLPYSAWDAVTGDAQLLVSTARREILRRRARVEEWGQDGQQHPW